MTRMKVTLHEDKYTVFISRSFLLRMRNVSKEICREIQDTRFIFNTVTLFRKSYRLWDNMEKYVRAREARDDKWHMRIACLTITATDTHSYIICNSYCFRRQR